MDIGSRNSGDLLGISARACKSGFNPGALDALIAATAVAKGRKVATLNRKHFEKLGVDLVEF